MLEPFVGRVVSESPETTYEFFVNGEEASFEFWYPILEDHVQRLTVGMTAVRAADPIRISFDHARNGWSIERDTGSSWDEDGHLLPLVWHEVVFLDAMTPESEARLTTGE